VELVNVSDNSQGLALDYLSHLNEGEFDKSIWWCKWYSESHVKSWQSY